MTVAAVTPPVPVTGVFTVSAIVVVCVSAPLTPVIVTVAAPRVAVLDAVKVSVLVPVVDAGLKAAVTPAGNPLALSATLPVNPPEGVMVIVLLAVAPWLTDTLAGLAANV
jgi:CDP-diglyceride synthetase